MEELTSTTDNDGARVELPAVLDIRAAAPLKSALAERLGAAQATVLDAGAVTRLSTPCIQVLVAGQKAFRAADLPFKLARPSEPFVEAFDDLGLFPVLKRWDIEA